MMNKKNESQSLYALDMKRNPNAGLYVRMYLWSFRNSNSFIGKLLHKILSMMKGVEIPVECRIGGGIYLGHVWGITVHPQAILGANVNLHKGVTIGAENRGNRKGTPTIGNNVWIGINATIVGAIHIGDDVLIAPNCYVNCDVPSHSIVFGNPCVIKPKSHATEGYI